MSGQGCAAAWSDLVGELDRWGEAGRVATLWWRDDDAVAATPRLEALLRLAGAVPLALAVIPALAEPDLASALSAMPQVAVWQHGWQHANRAVHGKKSEYPPGRAASAVGAEIGAGRARLRALFGSRARPVLVPPWNRFAEEFLPLLPEFGIAGLSATPARHGAAAMPDGLARIDVHVDLVAWRAGGGFVGEAVALGGLVASLQAARRDAGPAGRPIGILTHHRIMDRASFAFVERLIERADSHGAVRWAAPGDFWPGETLQ